jgi:diamine N-acetyltransferase
VSAATLARCLCKERGARGALGAWWLSTEGILQCDRRSNRYSATYDRAGKHIKGTTRLMTTSNPPSVAIRLATPKDVAKLIVLGRKTFTDTFGHLYAPDVLEGYLQDSYNAEYFDQAIASSNKHVIVAEDTIDMTTVGDGDAAEPGTGLTLAGYAVASNGCSLPHDDVDESDAELNKIYLDSAYQGTGLADRLMENVLEWCLQAQPDRRVWLGVYSENFRAQR